MGRGALGLTVGVQHQFDQRHVIVGVVENIAYSSLRHAVGPALYVPLERDSDVAPIGGAASIYSPPVACGRWRSGGAGFAGGAGQGRGGGGPRGRSDADQ